MKSFSLKILTPEHTAWDDAVEQLILTDVNGNVTILPGHAPMVSVLAAGPLRIRAEGKERTGKASGGILHVTREETAVILDSFQWDDESREA